MFTLTTGESKILRVVPVAVDNVTPKPATNVAGIADNNNILIVGTPDPATPFDIPVTGGVPGPATCRVTGKNELNADIAADFQFTVNAVPSNPAVSFIATLV